MSLRATVGLSLTVRETVATDAAGYASETQNSVTFDGGNVDAALTATTTPAITAHAVGQQALSSGVATLDLRTLTGLNGVAVDLNGLAPRAVLFENPETNADAITITTGASNGYTGFGVSYLETLQPGAKSLRWLDATGTAVSGSVKTLDLAGTGTQALNYQIVAGT